MKENLIAFGACVLIAVIGSLALFPHLVKPWFTKDGQTIDAQPLGIMVDDQLVPNDPAVKFYTGASDDLRLYHEATPVQWTTGAYHPPVHPEPDLPWFKAILVCLMCVGIGLMIGYRWGQRAAYSSGLPDQVYLEPYSFDREHPITEGPS